MRAAWMWVWASWAVVATAAEPVVSVPLAASNRGHPMIELHARDGSAIWCVVDTGAMAGVASERLIQSLGADASRLDSVQTMGVKGPVQVERFELTALTLGTLALPPMRFVQQELKGLSGPDGQEACVIGQALLTPYAVEFDGIGQRLQLWPPEAAKDWPEQHAAERTDFSSPLAAFPVHRTDLDKGQIHWVLDTGAPVTTLNPEAAAALGVDVKTAPVLRTSERRGLDGAPRQVPSYAIPPTTIYAGLRPQREVEVTELPVLPTLTGAAEGQPGGLIGADILRGQRLLIDYAGKAIWVATAVKDAPTTP